MRVDEAVSCGAPWLGLLASSTPTVNFNATGLAVSNHEGFLCISTNEPKPAVPVNFRVLADDVYADGFEPP